LTLISGANKTIISKTKTQRQNDSNHRLSLLLGNHTSSTSQDYNEISREHYRTRCWNPRCQKSSWHQVEAAAAAAAAVDDDDDDVDDDDQTMNQRDVLPAPHLRFDSRQKVGAAVDLWINVRQIISEWELQKHEDKSRVRLAYT